MASEIYTFSRRVFSTLEYSLIGSLLSELLLISVYTFSSLSWMVWIAFVPFLFVSKDNNHSLSIVKVHFNSYILISIYFSYIYFLKNLDKFFHINYLIYFYLASFVIVSQIQLLNIYLTKYDYLVMPVIWTLVALILKLLKLPFINNFFYYISIYSLLQPLPQPLLKCIPNILKIYLLLFLVLFANYYLAHILFKHKDKIRKLFLKLLIFYF